jgi:NADPH-dependent glutamate synthase beta subunit-like oxidoreductase/Pyruvate/2-oxoacid:ferredoxin oxidoreductase delta subunit
MKDALYGGAEHVSLFLPISRTTTKANNTGAWSFMRPRYAEKTAPCSARCPCGEDIPRIEMLVSRGEIGAAWRTILDENPFPGICGRVCFHPCETACNRGERDEPVSINALERFIDQSAAAGGEATGISAAAPNGRKIAIAGAGPAGLAAAYFLARLGYSCELFEASKGAGGVLRSGIPAYRLPAEALEREVRRIEALGVKIHYSSPMGDDFTQAAKGRFDAVFVACGNGKPQKLGVPGDELAADGLEFLDAARNGGSAAAEAKRKGGTAIVVGGGNSAIDVARTLVRLGVSTTIVYRRRREDMPAFGHEVTRALEEGVRLVELRAPLSVEKSGSGIALKVRKMRPAGAGADGRMKVVPEEGAPETIHADAIYAAIGAAPAEAWMSPPRVAAVASMSHCAALWSGPAGVPILYGGDPVNADESVADAIASGKQAAIALDAWFSGGAASVEAELARSAVGDGRALSMELYRRGPRSGRASRVVALSDINLDYFPRSRGERGSSLAPEAAVAGFGEVEAALDAARAAAQAERCFNCGICNDCDNCRTFCPEVAVFAARAEKGAGWFAEAGPDRSVDSSYCKGCGICVKECPRSAMVIEEQQS